LREFFDSSVLVAAFPLSREHHERSRRQIEEADKRRSACAIRFLTAFHATLSAFPGKAILHPGQMLSFVERISLAFRQSCAIPGNTCEPERDQPC
jgi:predicted nucleic acid-binding protein